MAVRCFVYVLPCRDRDLLKIGFSREPLRRLQTLHPRYFEFFDLERSLLIETDRLRDARRIEREFISTYISQRAEAPLQVPRSAAGIRNGSQASIRSPSKKPVSCVVPPDFVCTLRLSTGCATSLQGTSTCCSIGRIVHLKKSDTYDSTQTLPMQSSVNESCVMFWMPTLLSTFHSMKTCQNEFSIGIRMICAIVRTPIGIASAPATRLEDIRAY
jgi:hypothetical protein